ncbi:tetratricopeptide repeat protein [Pantoea brenneri]|uniref:tetratricopeptide repeat protein n=1 Tax=Pantoea brenneri TaxID=472694 RepID=UPI00289C2042|nr:tetratricopeptide repeat protein [Pantoea brenneri]
MRKTIPVRRPAVSLNPAALNARLESSAAQFRAAMQQGDYAQAVRSCEEVLRYQPHQMQVLSDYALCLMRLGQHHKAYKTYQKIYQSPPAVRATASETWLDGLTEVCGWLDKQDEVARYGLESLMQSDARFRQGPRVAFPAAQPEPIDLSQPQQNVIAFCLYGDQPRYCETLIKNVEVAPQLFPGWVCRIYLDDSVPQHVWQRLDQPHVERVDMSQEKTLFPTLWRFLVMDDPSVKRFIVRDADSLLSEREAAAVNAWLASPYWFHHMRDYFSHTELLLAGMWGGCHGVFQQVEQTMREFIAQYRGSERFTDQYFLKTALWPTVRESILNHDELFHFHQAQPWPAHPPVRWQMPRFHVGSNVGFASLTGQSAAADGTRQAVDISAGGKSWQYPAQVKSGQWLLPMPFFLIEDWQAGKLTVTVR